MPCGDRTRCGERMLFGAPTPCGERMLCGVRTPSGERTLSGAPMPPPANNKPSRPIRSRDELAALVVSSSGSSVLPRWGVSLIGIYRLAPKSYKDLSADLAPLLAHRESCGLLSQTLRIVCCVKKKQGHV